MSSSEKCKKTTGVVLIGSGGIVGVVGFTVLAGLATIATAGAAAPLLIAGVCVLIASTVVVVAGAAVIPSDPTTTNDEVIVSRTNASAAAFNMQAQFDEVAAAAARETRALIANVSRSDSQQAVRENVVSHR